MDRGSEKAQILRDDLLFAQGPLHRLKQLDPRSLPPPPVLSGGLPIGDGVVGVKAPEVIDPQHIVDLTLIGDAAHPPGKVVSLHVVPVKEGVAPQLAVGGEAVGGTARHLGGPPVLVQLELLRVGPHVHAVGGDIDGQVPDDPDAFPIGVFLECLPLAEKEVLHPTPEGQIGGQGPAHPVECHPVPVLNGRFPVGPGFSAVGLLHSHKEGVVLQPEGIFLAEGPVIRGRCGQQRLAGLPQHRIAVLIQFAVIHPLGVAPPVQSLIVRPVQQAVGRQVVQINEVGVTGKGGKALIGGISIAGGTDGQDLPQGLARRLEEIHEPPGTGAHGAHAVGGWQRSEVHQDAAGPHSFTSFPSRSPLPKRYRGSIHGRASLRPESGGSADPRSAPPAAGHPGGRW